MGLFTSSVNPGPDVQPVTAREILRDLKVGTLSHAKNFGIVGGLFAAIECCIESVKATSLTLA